MRASVKGDRVGKSALSAIPRRDAEGRIVPEAADFILSRKAASEEVGARTVNRHR